MARARSALVAVVAAISLGRLAGGQTPPGDSLARRVRIDAAALKPSQFVYETTLERDAGTAILGTRTVTVSMATYANSAAWLLLENRSSDSGLAVDSLFTDLFALRPLHWSAVQGPARLGVEFRGDTAFGGTSGPPGRRSMITVIPSGSMVSAAMLETALRLLPLQSTWEDSSTIVSITLGGNSVLQTRLAVIGEDRVRVPAGTFDCWVVAVRADPARGLYWVTKRDPIVVRTAIDVPTLGSAQLINSLTRIGR